MNKIITKLFAVLFAVTATGFTVAFGNTDKLDEPQFIVNMAEHHKDGIEMAKMAEQMGASKEILKMSKKIVKDQTKEIAQLNNWKQKWYPNSDIKAEVHKMDMSKLHSAQGKEFDKMFLEMMSHHHQGAIDMAKNAIPNLSHKEVKRFADKAVKKQTEEIQKMKKIESAIE